jgi:hypothetical protein
MAKAGSGRKRGAAKTVYLPEKLRNHTIEFVKNSALLKLKDKAGQCSIIYNKKGEATGCESVDCTGTCEGPFLVVFFDGDGKPHSYYVCRCSGGK